MTESIPESAQAMATLKSQEAPIINDKEQVKSALEEMDEDSGDDDSILLATDDEEDENSEEFQNSLRNKQITLYLFREDKANDYQVSFREISELVFKRLNVPDGKLVSFDTTPYKKIILELAEDVGERSLNITQSLMVRPGLWTKPLQMPEKDRKVNIR